MKWKTDIVISVASGRLCCNDIGDVYKLLNYMTGEDVYTHQLPRACDACFPCLAKQFPWLTGCREEINGENYEEWTEAAVGRHGETLDVEPLKNGEFKHVDPLKELVSMRGRRIVVVNKETGKEVDEPCTQEEAEQKAIDAEVAKCGYTKGNWKINFSQIVTDLEVKGRTGGYGCDHHFVCDFDDDDYHGYDDKSEQLANMLLVQAAPVMHRALIYACMKCPNRHGRKEPPFCRVGCPIYMALRMVRGYPRRTVPEEWREEFDKMQDK